MAANKALTKLKNVDLNNLNVSLAIIKEYKRGRISQYDVKYVQTNEPLKKRLKKILVDKIESSNSVEEYSFDCPEPEGDQIRSINYEETDFFKIVEQLKGLNPEEDIIHDVDELVKAKAYLIILRNQEGVQIVGFKTIPENWKLRKNKGLIPLLFEQNQFKDLEDENVFSISSTVDLFFYDGLLFILSKKSFEYGLNFREGMISRANEMYEEARSINVFINIDLLIEKVGNNQRYLRKIATIKNLGHYKNQSFLQKLKTLNDLKGWNIEFQDEQIVFAEETLESILTLLQNKRLYSELTEENFDVDSAKLLQ